MNLSSHFPLTLISNRFLCHSLTQKHFFCTRLTVHWRDGYCNAFNVWLIYDGISRIVIYILRLCLYAAFCCCLIASIPEGGVNAPFALINVRDRLSRKVKKRKRKKRRSISQWPEWAGAMVSVTEVHERPPKATQRSISQK